MVVIVSVEYHTVTSHVTLSELCGSRSAGRMLDDVGGYGMMI